MAKPRRRTAAKIATKREQGELVSLAERLGEDPTPLVPATDGRRPRRIERLERRLRRIGKKRQSPRSLRWAIRFGPQLARAYANLLLVGHAGKAQRMASMPTPVGNLKYAVRGNVSKRHLVAVQHFRYPEVRILAYRDLAQEAGGVVWATAEGTAYTPAGAAPPPGWYDLVLPRLPGSLTHTGDTVRCPHFLDVTDPQDPRAPAGLALTLDTGPTTFLVCRTCIGDHFATKGLLATIGMFLIGLNPPKDVHVAPAGTPHDCQHAGTCAWVRNPPELRKQTLERYRSGGMSEADLMERFDPAWEEAVRSAGERLLVAGGHCHGDDIDGFLDDLGADGALRDAVRRFVEAGPPVLLADERSINKVLQSAWDAAPEVLRELHPDRDPEVLRRLLERHRKSQPTMVLMEVLEAREAAEALAGFPRYDGLPPQAAVADRLARAARIGGDARLTEEVDRELKRGSHKGLLWAALRIAGNTQGREWQFPQNDQEAGEFLEDPLRALLQAGPENHHERLAQVHTLAGGAGTIPEPSGKHGG